MGKRKRDANAGRLDAPPARRQVPQEEHETHFEARLGGDRAEHVEIGDAPARASEQRQGDLRPRSHAFGELRVEQGEPGRAESMPGVAALEEILLERARGLEEVTRSDELGRGAVADAGVDRDQPVEEQQAGPAVDGLEPPTEVARADLGVEDPRGGNLADGEAHPEIELLRQIVVRVEEIGVQRRR
jgi:hypothetical protein